MTTNNPTQPGDNEPIVTGNDQTVMVQVPQQLGCYHLTKMLGRGGMGEVWLALDTKLEREVAIKLMRRDLLANEEAVKRFSREARAVARLNHPNIVQVYSFGDEKGVIYMVMELVEGETVTQRIKRHTHLVMEEAGQILMQTIEGLSYANARGIIHRDIKPSNLMLTTDFKTKIADFGLAKMIEHDTQMTAAGTTMGSPNYMSPEQARGEEADHRSDIYALGISFYQMLTGELPFTAQTPLSVLLKQIQEPLPEPEFLRELCDGRLLNIIKKMTQKDPEERFQTYGGLAAAVADVMPNLAPSIPAHSPTTSMPTPQPIPPGSFQTPPATPSQVSAASTHLGNAAVAASAKEGRTNEPLPTDSIAPPPSDGRAAPASSKLFIYAGVGTVACAAIAGFLYFSKTGESVHSKPDATVASPPAAKPGESPETKPTAPPSPIAAAVVTPIPVYIVSQSPTPSSTPAYVPPITPVETPTPTPEAVSVSTGLEIGPTAPPGGSVSVYDANHQVISQIPKGPFPGEYQLNSTGGQARYKITVNGREGYIDYSDAKPLLSTGNSINPIASSTAVPSQARMIVLGAPGGSPNERIPIYKNPTDKHELRFGKPGEQGILAGETTDMYRIVLDGKELYIYKKSSTVKP